MGGADACFVKDGQRLLSYHVDVSQRSFLPCSFYGGTSRTFMNPACVKVGLVNYDSPFVLAQNFVPFQAPEVEITACPALQLLVLGGFGS